MCVEGVLKPVGASSKKSALHGFCYLYLVLFIIPRSSNISPSTQRRPSTAEAALPYMFRRK